MSGTTCQKPRLALGVDALGALDAEESAEVADHVRSCEDCGAERAELDRLTGLLAMLTPEEVAAGPAQPSDLMLPRLFARASAERADSRRRRFLAVAAAVVVFVTAPLAAVGIFRGSDERSSPPVAQPAPQQQAADVWTVSATDSATGVEAQVVYQEFEWGTKMSLRLENMPNDVQCRLVAESRTGVQETAGSWVVPPGGYTGGPNPGVLHIQGGVAFPPSEIARFRVVTFDDRELVTVQA